MSRPSEARAGTQGHTTTGAPSGHWDENLIASVSSDGQSYSGTYARFFYGVNGNFLFEDDGTLTAERLPEHY